MKVTIEFDAATATDLEILESVFKARAAERGYTPPVYITAPPPAAPRPSVEPLPAAPMAVPSPSAVFSTPETPAEPPVGLGNLPFNADPTARDADGLPWDGRIHSSSKALLVDGKWRQRRNTDPAVVAAVTAELRAALGAPAPVAAAVVVPPVFEADPGVAFGTPLVPPAPPALAVVPPPPPADATLSFPDFMRAITAARIPPGTVLDACKAVGMPSIPALNQRPDLIPTVAAALGVA